MVAGSSPLTRGKQCGRPDTVVQRGLIPAHEGTTEEAAGPRSCQGAHPRSRGENPHSITFPSGVKGSSPLTRGKLSARAASVMVIGLIPAHAGKTPDSLIHIH